MPNKFSSTKFILSTSHLIKLLGIEVLDENEHLVSFKPCFGSDAANNLINAIKDLGLESVDDYFLIEGDLPD